MAVTAEMVKKLRERTGVGMSKCKKALDDAGGDMDKAIELLRKAGAASAVKKSDRTTNEGLIGFKEDSSNISIVEVNAETDFVVKNEKFQQFVEGVTKTALEKKVSSLDALLSEKSEMDSARTNEEMRAELIQTIGENIQIKRVLVVAKNANCSYGLYRHSNGKIVTLVEVKGSDKAGVLAKDLAMHVAAESPEYLKSDDVPADVIEKEKEIAQSQIKNKPPEIVEKILVGKIKAFCDQVCLVGQKYVKDPSLSVTQHVAAVGKELGATLEVSKFVRWQIGEE